MLKLRETWGAQRTRREAAPGRSPMTALMENSLGTGDGGPRLLSEHPGKPWLFSAQNVPCTAPDDGRQAQRLRGTWAVCCLSRAPWWMLSLRVVPAWLPATSPATHEPCGTTAARCPAGLPGTVSQVPAHSPNLPGEGPGPRPKRLTTSTPAASGCAPGFSCTRQASFPGPLMGTAQRQQDLLLL